MKTLKQVKLEMVELMDQMSDKKQIDTKEARTAFRNMKVRLTFLKQMKLYLQTEPKEEFILKERERITSRINALMERFVPLSYIDSATKKIASAYKKEYEKEFGIPKLRVHLRTINYLLK